MNYLRNNKVFFLILGFVFLLSFQPHTDLDLGWHLRYGQHFFTTGQVLKENIISFVWPNYRWVQASWGYDLLLYQLFSNFGFFSLSLATALTTVGIFFLLLKDQRQSWFRYFFLASLFLLLVKPLYISGFRAQTLSALFFTIVLIISDRYFLGGRNRKLFYFLPFIMMIWANIHGGFVLGLLLLVVYGTTSVIFNMFNINTQKINISTIKIIFIILASILTPLLNPFGFDVYKESFIHASNTHLVTIQEWMPLSTYPGEFLITLFAASIALYSLFSHQKEKRVTRIVILIGFFLLALSALRFTILFGILSIYYLMNSKRLFIKTPLLKIPNIRAFLKILFVAVVFFDIFLFKTNLSLPPTSTLNFSWNTYCQLTHECSEGLTHFLEKNVPRGNGFHPYTYGGYLSWRLPKVKTFVDGRMAAWEENQKTPPIADSFRALNSRNPVFYRKLENIYHFSWVILPSPSWLTTHFDRLSLTKQWEKKYSDEYFSYYTKR